MATKIKFLDLFAGAGGLSEGFIRAGFKPIAHVEADQGACYTLRTRMSYHWLMSKNREEQYAKYLQGELNRPDFYAKVPDRIGKSIINAEIGKTTLPYIFEQIDTLLGKQKLDLIIGGPPCQAYSLVGRARDEKKMMQDKRNYLYVYYAEFLKRYKPRYFIFENVSGLLSARDQKGKSHLATMRKLFLECGYKTELDTLSAENYGVLQRRKRIILVGRRGKTTGFYPAPDKWTPTANVKEVFCDLPALSAGQGNVRKCKLRSYRGTWQYEAKIRNDEFPVTWHQARPNTKQDLEIYRIAVERWNKKKQRLNYNDLPKRLKTHHNRVSFIDRFKVVAEDLDFAHTVVAHIAKDGHYYIHPDVKQNRSITPREAARLQTFPDDYYFESQNEAPGRTPVFCQIGNAVPVLLAQKVAERLQDTW